MSRDIRSYFGVKPTKKVDNPPDKKSKEPNLSRKKKRAIIESDSDEEDVFVRASKSSPGGTSGTKKPKVEIQKVKKPEAEKKFVSASDVFGSTPIQRIARKGSIKGFDAVDDPDIVKALQDVAESEWNLASPTKTNGNSSVKDIPQGSLELLQEVKSQRTDATSEKHASSSMSDSSSKKETLTSAQNDSFKSSSHIITSKHVDILAEAPIAEKSSPPPKKQKVSSSDNDSPKTSSSIINNQHGNVEAKMSAIEKLSPLFKKQKISITANSSTSSSSCTITSKHFDGAVKQPVSEKSKQDSSPPSQALKSTAVSHLWVDKYKPTSLKQIIGQQGESSNVKKLLKWLSAWHSNHGPGVNKKLVRPSPWARDDSGSYFKAALLSGPPGVGKTTTAHLVCKELGMDLVEFNASDTRSKKLMNQEVTELLSSKTLLPFFESGGGAKTSAKHVLVMDEVDGMAGNEDRGGVQELINLIKNSKCPVICMCNDRNHPKIRSLSNYCFDLRFYKPRLEQIKGAMMSVCFKEKVQISPEALNEVIAATNCDIRQILHNLSMWSAADKKLNTEQTKSDAHTAKKHIKLGPWDTVKSIFSPENHSKMSLNEKSDLFFNDYNIMPLFVQENYLIVSPSVAKKGTQTLRQIARASTSISFGDMVEKTIRSRNDAWSLLPVQAIYASVVPGDLMEGRLTGQIQFPSWLGKNSTYGKMNRMLQELKMHMRLSISGGKQAVNLDYVQSLQNAIVTPLVENGAAGVPDTLQIMQDYHLTLADLESLFELSQWPGQPHPMSKVESKVKAALTRTYNKSGIMTPYSIEARVSKRRGASSAVDEETVELEGDEKGKDSDSDSDEADDAMIKVKKQESSAKASASTSRGSTRGSRGGRGGAARAARGSEGRGRGRGKGKK